MLLDIELAREEVGAAVERQLEAPLGELQVALPVRQQFGLERHPGLLAQHTQESVLHLGEDAIQFHPRVQPADPYLGVDALPVTQSPAPVKDLIAQIQTGVGTG